MNQDLSYEEQRQRMVEKQLVGRKIHDTRVLTAMRKVPRHLFVPKKSRDLAYADGPLPIGKSQTISQPYVVALMAEMLGLHGHEKTLEIGTGCGYQAAVLGYLAKEVFTIERHEVLAKRAEGILTELRLTNVQIRYADGSAGLPEEAPFEGILVAAAAPKAPQVLLEQLTDGGVLVIPVGGKKGQRLQRWVRIGNRFEHEEFSKVSFVPLRGEFGWQRRFWT